MCFSFQKSDVRILTYSWATSDGNFRVGVFSTLGRRRRRLNDDDDKKSRLAPALLLSLKRKLVSILSRRSSIQFFLTITHAQKQMHLFKKTFQVYEATNVRRPENEFVAIASAVWKILLHSSSTTLKSNFASFHPEGCLRITYKSNRHAFRLSPSAMCR